MGTTPVNSWDTQLAVVSETTFGTTPAPASTSAYGARMLEMINADLGGPEVGNMRAKQDRPVGRGPTNGFVEGRVMPIPFTVATSMKTRAAVDTASPLLALLKAAGLVHTINSGTNVTITPSQTPVESGDFAGLSLTQWMGSGLATQFAQTLRGGVVKSLGIEGGAAELIAKFSGDGIGKTTATSQAGVQGKIDSVTLANNSVTSLTVTADDSYRLAPGYYLIESEIVLLTACTPGGTSATITRGALASTAAAHTAVPMVPYKPTPSFTGNPISEAVASLTVDGVSFPCRNFSFDLTTGLSLIENESGSRYPQRPKTVRYEPSVKASGVLQGNEINLFGKHTARKSVAIALSQGTGTGGIVTINVPYAEIVMGGIPDTANDVAAYSLDFRIREGTAGESAFSIVLT